MKLILRTGTIAGFLIGDLCLILAIFAKLSGGAFVTIDAAGYLRLAGTIFLGAITLGVYNMIRQFEDIRNREADSRNTRVEMRASQGKASLEG